MSNDIDLAELQAMSRQQKEDLAKNIFVRPSIWSRLKKLPIYLHREGTAKEKKVHISDEQLAEKVPKEREKFLKLVKDTPEIIDEIEKHPRLEQIVFTSETLPLSTQKNIPFSQRKTFRRGFTYFQDKKSFPFSESEILPRPMEKQIQKDVGTVVISLKTFPYKRFKEGKYDVAEATFHELRHVGQMETYHKQPKDLSALFKGKYKERKGEAEAREFAEKKVNEPMVKWQKQYEQGKTANQGYVQNPDVQEAIKRADLLLKRTY
jgi:hypothetical protein